ncbi:hypothetical protein 3S4_38 [uncultured Caudovirales phage]|uniref:Uncharacterized protein n=2 Tax=uncultured Caudovirales phage TaxID=2100421 RepID=A0A2H4J7A7_9CAUD|nr:hypothetical protein 3S4_38 [uncultured Caudovirales phage]
MMSSLPREWVAALDNIFDLATDPEKHAAKLVSMALECRRRRQVGEMQLSEMLEMADAARLFGLNDHEEMYEMGLFKYLEPQPDHYVHEILRKGNR